MENRFNIFTMIHKGLRHALQRLVYQTGRLPIDERLKRDELFAEFKQVAIMLHTHAKDEDTFVQPLLERYDLELSKELEKQHVESEALLEKMEHIVSQLEGKELLTPEEQLLLLTFIDDLNKFTGDYYLHLYQEECVEMPVLWKHFTDEELINVEVQIIQSIPPEVNAIIYKYMFPAMNKHEQFMMLLNVRNDAPKEVFHFLCGIAESSLHASEWEELQSKLTSVSA